MNARFTIFGAGGFIGAHLKDRLISKGHEVSAPARGEEQAAINAATRDGHGLGHVIYAIGLTANFRAHPLAAVEAHVSLLSDMIATANFDSWLYLSSTRVYARLPGDVTATEDTVLPVSATPDELYNLSKLLGEAICASFDNPSIRVARLSNVYGEGQNRTTFLASVIHDLIANGSVMIGETPSSTKDYVSLDDVCDLLTQIALSGQHRTYNVASGTQTTHADIAEALTKATGSSVTFADGGSHRAFPAIDISRIRNEFGFAPRALLDDLAALARAAAQRTEP